MRSKLWILSMVMLCLVFTGTNAMAASGFSPDPYINGLQKALDNLNEQTESQYDNILSDFREEVDEIREEEAEAEAEEEQARQQAQEAKNQEVSDNLAYRVAALDYNPETGVLEIDGYFENANADYEIYDIANMKLTLYAPSGEQALDISINGSEDTVVSAGMDTNFDITVQDVSFEDQDLSDYTYSYSYGFKYRKVQKASSATGNASTALNPSAQYAAPAVPELNQPAEADCPVCGGTGRVECESCHGTGYLSFTKHSIDLGSGSSSYEEKQLCPTCGGSKKQTCLSCLGDGKL